MLGVPPDHVSLLLYSGFVGITNKELLREPPAISETKECLFPRGYNDYFVSVYENARGIDAQAIAELDRSTFRVISGHGFFDFQHGGFIRCGKETFSFRELKESCATALNILDISNSPHAVACFNDKYPTGQPSKFKWKHVFRNPQELHTPIVCDKSPSTWAFRVGYEGQAHDDGDTNHWIHMSAPVGDAVTSCVIMAIKSLAESNFEGPSLDELFVSHYSLLRTGYLAFGSYTPKGFADLRLLQVLIKKSIIKMDLSKCECEFFRRYDKWFLTHERATVLGDADGDLAKVIIDHVVRFVKEWHEGHPDSLQNISEKSTYSWNILLKTLGRRFRGQLKSFELDYADDTNRKLVVSDDGILFEAFALSCGEMDACVQQVNRYLETGRFDSESDD